MLAHLSNTNTYEFSCSYWSQPRPILKDIVLYPHIGKLLRGLSPLIVEPRTLRMRDDAEEPTIAPIILTMHRQASQN
jgi:hypothetical protein